MIALKERYVVDENGNRIGVLLDMTDYARLLGELEELEAIRAYDAAKASSDETVPFEQMFTAEEWGETLTSSSGLKPPFRA